MIGVFIVSLDKLKDPDWKTLPLGDLASSLHLWSTASLAYVALADEDRQKAYEAVTRIQKERRGRGSKRANSR